MATAPRILCLFPDTNVFIHCKALEELDWTALGDFSEIRLIVCRAVQAEIDVQKGLREGRKQRKARATATLLRRAVNDGAFLVRSDNPVVTLSVNVGLRPTEALTELDYRERDDQLVGVTHAYQALNEHVDARVLTGDLGPLASARMVGVEVLEVPDGWLLPPESSEEAKKIKRLETALAKATDNRPEFEIEYRGADGFLAKRLEAVVARYAPLSDSEIAALLQTLTSTWPLQTTCSEPNPAERQLSSVIFNEVFVPPTKEEITHYRERLYPKWRTACEQLLRGCHTSLDTVWPLITFMAKNVGATPAKDALVTLEAKGDFQLTLPPSKRQRMKKVGLPAPPTPPRGLWKQRLNDLTSFERLARDFSLDGLGLAPRVPTSPIRGPERRDPNSFYWKPERPWRPMPSMALECEQWRHGLPEEPFEALIQVDKSASSVSGAVELQIHAENLVEPAILLVPVRIEVRDVSPFDAAMSLVEDLKSPKSSRGSRQ